MQPDNPQHRSARPGDAPSLRTVVSIPARWSRFLRRVSTLPEGRYIVVLTVGDDSCDWSVESAGRVER